MHHSYFSQRDVDERVAPKEEFEEELATTSYDFVPEKKEHGTHRARQSSSSSSVSEEGEKVETHDVVDFFSTLLPSLPRRSRRKKTPKLLHFFFFFFFFFFFPKVEYNQAISDRQKAELAAEKAREDRIEAEKNAADAKKEYEEAMKWSRLRKRRKRRKPRLDIAEQKVNHLNDESWFGESRLAKAPVKEHERCAKPRNGKTSNGLSPSGTCRTLRVSRNGGVNDMGNAPEMWTTI